MSTRGPHGELDQDGRLPATVWLTGLPAAGKTTIAVAVRKRLEEVNRPSILLDGDELRAGLTRDLRFDRESRRESVRRVAEVAALINASGSIAVVALVSPYAADRSAAREAHLNRGLRFIEAFVDTPLEICETRDPNGLYRAARVGAVESMTGIDDPYERPTAPDLLLRGWGVEPVDSANEVVAALLASTQ